MKKLTLAICTALASTAASADTILGLDATAGMWKPAYSGLVGAANVDADDFGFAEDNATFLQVALEHPIPLIPNIMVAHSKIETNGVANLSQNVEFGGETFIANQDISANLTLTHTDATLYYEILDNWVNLDLGLTARQYDGYFEAANDYSSPDVVGAIPATSETLELSGVLPMVYGMVRFDLPFTGWSIIAQGNGTSYNGDSHTDVTAKIRWDFVPALDFAVEAGYRAMTLDVQELDVLESDLDIKGPYLGLSLHL
ncbi:TIGR04219 family outer membrane beta-barrel protein [Microbulbifer bruguierae]|uniref:TIGR04219 family outer membrane beta-barrel protein n=1 Tax=Microbulbifer bruguierae TaxID=3029061 RepID=A0ABY8NGX1_9GAMM|nr:TIGR04219 family outer membrane beta-barrel protein [Microbulbifer bruguierae]WGL17847.1 TIGR04219 family outer membrane beta-barrel protein [Microbulbifer bruguierae]